MRINNLDSNIQYKNENVYSSLGLVWFLLQDRELSNTSTCTCTCTLTGYVHDNLGFTCCGFSVCTCKCTSYARFKNLILVHYAK